MVDPVPTAGKEPRRFSLNGRSAGRNGPEKKERRKAVRLAARSFAFIG